MKNGGFNLVLLGQKTAFDPPSEPRKSGRSRKSPQPELLPQRSTRRTPAPAELGPQRSTRHTPGPELPPQRSSRRTPAAGTESPQQRSSRRTPALNLQPVQAAQQTPATATTRKRTRVEEVAGLRDDAAVVAKKQKVQWQGPARQDYEGAAADGIPDISVNGAQNLAATQRLQNDSGTKKRKKRKSIGQQSLRGKSSKSQTPRSSLSKSFQGVAPRSKPSLPIQPSEEELRVQAQLNGDPFGGDKHPPPPPITEARDFARVTAELVVATTESVTGRKAKKRNAIGQKSHKGKVTTSGKGKLPFDTVPRGGIAVAEHLTDATDSQDEDVEDVADAANEAIEEDDVAMEHQNPLLGKLRRRKRKSIGQQRPRKKVPPSLLLPRNRTLPLERPPTSAPTGLDRTHEAANSPASVISRGRPRFRAGEEELQVEVESVSDVAEAPVVVPKFRAEKATAQSDVARAPKSAKAPNAGKRKTKTAPTSAPTSAPKPRNPPKDTIPITVYGPPSPASSEDDLSDVDVDPISAPQPLPIAKTINPVDVLSQICREMIHKTGNSLAEKARDDAERRGEWTSKKKTVELYGEELNARLLQLTKTLNTNNALTTRLRDSVREARSLKKEIKAMEEEKEQVKLEREEAIKVKKEENLKVMLNGIAGAVKKGWALQAKVTEDGTTTMENHQLDVEA